MAACNLKQLLQTSQVDFPSFLSQDESCFASVHRRKARHRVLPSSLSAFWRLGSGSVWKCSHGNLTHACSRSSTVVMENFPGRVDTAVDLGVKVSNLDFFPDILDARYRENNCTAPPVMPYYPPSDGNGPSELDFEIYASNSMEGYEPPPPPRIPFAFPFEDYYDEAIGVDYISKQEKPASSLLQFLDSLNAKKAEEGESNAKTPLSAQSLHKPTKTAEEEPGFLLPSSQGRGDGGVGIDSDEQASSSFEISSIEAQADLEQSAFLSNPAVEESPVSLHMSSREQTFGKPLNDQINTMEELRPAPSATVSTQVVRDTGKPSLIQAGITDQPMEMRIPVFLRNGISEEFKGSNISASTSSWVADEARTEDESSYSRSIPSSAKSANALAAPTVGPFQNFEDESVERIEGYSGQVLVPKSFDEKVSQSESGQNMQQNALSAETLKLHVNQIQKAASAKTGLPSLSNPATASRVPSSYTEVARYYEPREGDLIVGAITFINDQKVDLEIGAELSALMPLRDLQPLSQKVGKMLFEVPSSEATFDVPLGASLLVKDKTAFDGFTGNAVDIGTVVLAEVTGRTIIDGRAILSCKSPAQRLAWYRLEQLMRLGEAVQLEILQWNEGGLLGYFEGIRAFVPRSELLQRPGSISVLKSYVGKSLSVSILQADRQNSNLIASEVKAWMSKNLQLGTVHDVTVTRVSSYGMQVEVNNTKIRGFVHKTNFSNEYVSSVSNYFTKGDKARVMLIKGRNPGQISFGLTDLEKENGLLLRDKEQVFQDAEEMGRKFRDRFSEEERRLFGVAVSESSLDYQYPEIANLAWLHL